jgi:hypothetical protein
MAKKPLCILVTGLGDVYYQYSLKMISSLKKTNPNLKGDIKLYTKEDATRLGFTSLEPNVAQMRYMTPIFINELLQEYDCVVRLDSDQIITGDISHVWEGDFDAGVVQNANPRELVAQNQLMGRSVSVWDIPPIDYVNCGFVVVKSERFAKHWLKLCTPNRQHYQFYEQDFLNILCFYGDYNIRFLDREPNNKWHGLISKGYWSQIEKRGDKLFLPAKAGAEHDIWPGDFDKEIVCIHWAGGVKSGGFFENFETKFQPEVLTYLQSLLDETQKT